METKEKRLVHNTIIFTIGSLGSKFIQFLLVPLYTYTLTASQFGITEILLTAVNLLIPVFSISIADGLLRFGLDKTLRRENVLKSAFIISILGTILSIISIPIFSLYPTLSEWMIYFIIILNLRMYRDVFAIQLKVEGKNTLFACDSMIYTFVLSLASIVFLVPFSLGISGYFFAYIVSNGISIFFILFFGGVWKSFTSGRFEKQLMIQLLKYSAPMILNGIAWWITNASDRFMLQWFMDDRAVGLYGVVAKLPLLIGTFTGVFNQAWIISAVEEFEEENEEWFYQKVFHQYYAALFLSVSVFLLLLQPFMKVYVSPSFYEAWQYAPFLLLSSVVSGIAAFMTGFYVAQKKNLNIIYTTIAGAFANILLNAMFIPMLGVLGASIATFLSWFVIAIYRMKDVENFACFPLDKKVFWYLFLLCIQTITMTFLPILGIVFSVVLIPYFFYQEQEFLAVLFDKGRKKVCSFKKSKR